MMKKVYYSVALLCLFFLLNNGNNGSDSVKRSTKKDAAAQQTLESKTLALANGVSERNASPTIGAGVNLHNDPTATPSPSPKPTDPLTPTPAPNPEPNDDDPIHLSQYFASTQYNWSGYEWTCLYQLWQRESGFNPNAVNPSSGAMGIAQALPATKYITGGFDYSTKGQILWGLQYISQRYGDPISAWSHEVSYNWY